LVFEKQPGLMRLIVLGFNGFIGRNVFNFINVAAPSYNVIGFDRSVIDFTKPETFVNYTPLNGDVIIDCIARIDGDEQEVNAVNYSGFSRFIDYLKEIGVAYRYVYFSTYSTCVPEIVNSNGYVKSKYLAEKYLKENIIAYKIIRLIFPFGRGENSNRLVSRLIGKVKSGKMISVDKLILNLTPMPALLNDFWRMIDHPEKEVNYSNNIEIFLPDIVTFMQESIGMEKALVINDKELRIVVNSTLGGKYSENDIYKEIKLMLHE
jgi:nucleoside-diphosphate-sugar epimerase